MSDKPKARMRLRMLEVEGDPANVRRAVSALPALLRRCDFCGHTWHGAGAGVDGTRCILPGCPGSCI